MHSGRLLFLRYIIPEKGMFFAFRRAFFPERSGGKMALPEGPKNERWGIVLPPTSVYCVFYAKNPFFMRVSVYTTHFVTSVYWYFFVYFLRGKLDAY